jgi:hypothetical protein
MPPTPIGESTLRTFPGDPNPPPVPPSAPSAAPAPAPAGELEAGIEIPGAKRRRAA